jgi:hypothetical protein
MINLYHAQKVATRAHEGQFRKWTGEPYIQHPARVVGLLEAFGYTSDFMLAVAWLHDVLEDTRVTYGQISGDFGEPVAAMIQHELTNPNEPHTETAAIIKLCDIYDNVRNIAEVAPPVDALAYLALKRAQVDRIAKPDSLIARMVRNKIDGAMLLADGKHLLETPAYF